MKKTFFSLICILLLLPAKAEDSSYNSFRRKQLKSLNVCSDEGVSGHFAGISNDALIVAGGCNFPHTPAAKGGEKVFYDNIFVLENPLSEKSEWKSSGTLPAPTAYGVSLTTPEGIICIGGTDGGKSTSSVLLLCYKNGETKIETLTPLPIALDNMAGAYGNDYIYIAGGQSNGICSYAAFRIKLTDLIHMRHWERLPDFPGWARIQPAAAVQNNANDYCFYLIGGFAPTTDNKRCFIHSDGLIFYPKESRWGTTSEIRPNDFGSNAAIGSSAATAGNSHIV